MTVVSKNFRQKFSIIYIDELVKKMVATLWQNHGPLWPQLNNTTSSSAIYQAKLKQL